METALLRTLVVSDLSLSAGPFGGAMRFALVTRVLSGYGPVDLLLLRDDPAIDPGPTVFSRICAIRPERVEGSMAAQIDSDRRQILALAPEWVRAERYDLAWYNRERCWLRVRGLTSAPSIVDVDDREEELLRRWIDIGSNDAGGQLSEAERARMCADVAWWAATHALTSREAGALVFSSERDRQALGYPNSVVVPNTYPPPTATGPAAYPDGRPTIVFPALLDWAPNEDAAVSLVTRIAPRIRAHVPDLRVVLVGYASQRVRELADPPAVEVTGAVPEMAPYLRSAHLVAVPLRVAGGTRIKILEAFAYGLPVVSTTVGAEGLEVVPGTHLAVADDTDQFADACTHLLIDRVAASRLAGCGRDLYQRRYQPERAAERVREAVRMAVG